MFFAVPIFRLQHLFSFIIVSVLNKELNLTFRTNLWDQAFEAIRIHPIIGWGEQPADVKHVLYNSTTIISAHNQILEYIYIGGIILIALYFIINIRTAKRLHAVRENPIIQILSGLYFALQIALIDEVYTDALIYMLYFLVWYGYEMHKLPPLKSAEGDRANE